MESVQANTGTVIKLQTLFCNQDLAKEVVRQVKKVFASLVLIGCENTIKSLLLEGLTDK